jgi:flagellar biosynthesis/type III secretory pathway M-ring protein FliF/YscJ
MKKTINKLLRGKSKTRKIVTIIIIAAVIAIATIIMITMNSEDGFSLENILKNVKKAAETLEPAYQQVDTLIRD